MALLIPALSFFILILFNGCFTLPILDEQFSSSTFSLLNDDLTTEQTFNSRFVPNNETSVSPDMDKKGFTDEQIGFEMSTSSYNVPVEKQGQALRTFDDFFSTESMTFTTESPFADKRNYDELSFTTSESPVSDKRDYDEPSFTTSESSFADKRDYDELSFTTSESPVSDKRDYDEPSFTTSESSFADKRDYDELSFTTSASPVSDKRDYDEPSFTTSESSFADKRDYDELSYTTSASPVSDKRDYDELSFTTSESSFADKRDYDELSFTTVEPTTSVAEVERRSFKSEFENETETDSENDKRELQVDFTTSDTLSFTSTASSVAPELYTSQSSISNSTSTEKYTGLLKYQNDNEEEQEPEKPIKSTKTVKKVLKTKPSNVQPDDQSVEDPKEPTAPTAVFDQDPLTKVANIPNGFMVLDENNTFVVTDIPTKYSTTTLKNKNEQKPLSQGSTLLLFLLAALLLCACVMASTLAFVKNRYNLKRKSRVTEMEAHLDEHYQHYPHPFMFQQHYDKQ